MDNYYILPRHLKKKPKTVKVIARIVVDDESVKECGMKPKWRTSFMCYVPEHPWDTDLDWWWADVLWWLGDPQ